MSIDERNDIERDLGRLVARPVPDKLRERVLGSALEARKNAAMTPRMRVMAVVFSILIVAVLGIDLFLGEHEAARLAALIDGPGLSMPTGQEAGLLWSELGVDLGDSDKFRRAGIALSRLKDRDDSRKALLEARDWLKGMIDHEDPEDIF